MSAILALLERLDALDVKLAAESGKLRINAPKGSLTPALTDELRTHKAALIAFLEQGTDQRSSISPAPRDRALPLTLGQERLWFIDQMEGQSSAYNLSGTFRMQGHCDQQALVRALATVIARHEILRTCFPERDGRPAQHIVPAGEATVPFVHHDFRARPDAESVARALVRAQALAPFDLARGPLLRVVLVELAPAHALFLVAMHHIVSDGWSMGRFVEEVAISYEALQQGRTPSFPPLPIQYADFAAWQRQWAEAGQLAAQVAFWKRHLEGAPPLIDLPLDHPRPALQTYRGQTLHFALDGALGDRIRQLGQAQQCTPYMTLLAAFAVLLYRYSGQDDLPIASPIANRNRAETEALIGFFVNTLVTRIVVSPEQSFLDLLAQIKQTALDAFTHQDAPFSHVVDALSPERNASYNPVFQVMFDLQNAPAGAVEISGLRLEPLILDDGVDGTAMFDLSWTMQEQARGFTGQVEYAMDLFEQATIERFIASSCCLLEHITTDPASPIAALGLMPAAERGRVLALGSALGPDAPAGCMQHAVADQARRRPQATAVVWQDTSLTYGELDTRANQLAHHLRALGVGRGSLVGICLERCLEMPVAVLGVLKAGAAYVPLDPSYPVDRLAFMQRDAGLRLVLTRERLTGRLSDVEVEILTWEGLGDVLSTQPATAPDVPITPGDAAYVIYTSGSTGLPKGVVVAHGPWMQTYHAWEREYRLDTEVGSHLQMAAFSFDVCAGDFVRALCSGGKLVLCPRDHLLSPPDLHALMVREAVDCAEFVPAVLRELASHLEEQGSDLAFMRVLIAGSDVWYGEEYQRFRRLCGPRTRLVNSYGVTEAVIDSTYFEAGTRALHPERHVPIGRPFPDTRLYILDARGEPVPPGVTGELHLAGPRLARGYWQQPRLTAERFLPDPFTREPGARMYRTGDAARFLYDGTIEFTGRVDRQVKIRGHRIELGEIETALGKHPQVHSAVATAHAERPGHNILVAYVVPTTATGAQASLDLDQLRQFLAERLPGYMVPAVFLQLDALPMTPNGKIDRQALPAPRIAAAPAHATDEPPVGPVEQTIAAIWQDLLGVPVQRSGNFFAMGGDSILAIQVVSRARAAGLRLDPRLLFQYQTVAALAAAIAAQGSSAPAPAPTVVPATLTGSVPLTPVQHWFAQLQAPNPHHYNQSVLLVVDRDLDPDVLAAALQRLPALHPALRLRWHREGHGFAQAYGPQAGEIDVPCSVHDMVDEPGVDDPAWPDAIARVGTEVQTGLHLGDGPLLRAAFLRHRDSARLLLVAHHCIIDGVSWRILIEDLAMLLMGQEPMPATTPYSVWAAHLQERALAARTLADVPRWQRIVSQAPALPTDATDSAAENRTNTAGNARTLETRLDGSTTSALLTEVHRAYRTRVDDILLTALARAFHGQLGVRDILIDLESHGRPGDEEHLDLSRSVGWFTSVYPARLTLPLPGDDGGDDPGAAIKAIKEQLRALPEAGLTHGLLRYLHPDAQVRASVTPAQPVAVSFNYLGQLDQAGRMGPLRGLAGEAAGPEQDPALPRAYAIEINAYVNEGALVTTWEYAPALYRPHTIERLASAFHAALRALVDHCRDPRHGGLTPSDVPLARLDQITLDRLAEDVSARTGLLPREAIADAYPLAPMQAGMLYHSLLTPEHGFYVEQLRCTLRGSFQPALFERAWSLLTARHDILRTAFHLDHLPEPLQVVLPRVSVPARIEDWRRRDPAERARALDEHAASERARGFQIDQAPLFRWALIQLDDEQHHFIWTHHHLLVNGWSLPLLFQELFALVTATALHQGQPPGLPAALPYRNYIAWLHEQDLDQARSFWTGRLHDFEAPTPLPGDHTGRPGLGADHYTVLHQRLAPDVTRALEESARARRLTINTMVQAAWAILLGHYSGQRDVLFGATVAGRPPELAGAEAMIGLFINTLPVRIHVAPDAPLLPWLAHIQDRQQEAAHYAYTPLVDIQAASSVASGTPLFESLLVFENYPLGRDEDPSALLAIQDVHAAEHTNYPLTLVVAPGRQLELGLNYDASRFHPTFIGRVVERLAAILAHLAGLPATVGDLQRLDPEERALLVHGWNQTERAYPAGCLHHAIAEQARRTPGSIAVVARDEALTYAELDTRANRLAHHLSRQGVGPDVLVGLYAERSAAMLVALLAILKAGGAYVPLDPGFPADRLVYMAQDAGLRLLLTAGLGPAQGHPDALPDARPGALPDGLARGPWTIIDLDQLPALDHAFPATPPTTTASADHLAYAIYTSGSTGTPKGTLIEHRAVMSFLATMRERPGVHAGDALLAVTTLSFDIAVLELYLPLVTGARVVIASRAQAADADALRALIAEHRITVMQATPATWRMLIASGWEGTPGLRVLCGGEALPPDLAEALLPRVDQLWNMYGPTETTVWSAIAPITAEARDAGAMMPIGRPIANTQLYVLDADLQPVPVGAIGELYIGGDGLARGYHRRPDLTAARFVPDPVSRRPGSRLYRTGDLARYRLDGNLECLGRIDQQIKLRGHRIELGEIESQILAHPGVDQAVVLVREDHPGDQRLVAYVVARAPDHAIVSALQEHLASKLPVYMLPGAIVLMSGIPLTPNGKIDRRALPRPQHRASAMAAPRDALELQLIRTWEQVLGVEPIGIHDDFFALGGHSIDAIRLIAHLQTLGKSSLPLATLYQAPTVAAMAQAMRREVQGPASPIVSFTPHGTRPPFFCFPGAGGNAMYLHALARALGPDQPFHAARAIGLEPGEVPLHSIEDMAGAYLDTMRRIQPRGPFVLGGHSFGADVAWAVAARLREQGEDIALFVSFDSPAPRLRDGSDRADFTSGQWIATVASVLEQEFPFLDCSDIDWERLPEGEQLGVLAQRLVAAQILPDRDGAGTVERFVRVFRGNHQATFAPRPLHRIPVVLIQAADEPPELDHDGQPHRDAWREHADWGWSQLTDDRVQRISLPGDHQSIMQPPQVTAVAAALAPLLENLPSPR